MNDNPRVTYRLSRRAFFGHSSAVMAAFMAGCRRNGTPSRAGSTAAGEMTFTVPDAPASTPGLVFPAAASPDVAPASVPQAPPRPVVFIDPGHGGVDQGAVGVTSAGKSLDEKTVVLSLAEQTASKLRSAGFPVVLSRTTDALPGLQAADLTPDGTALTSEGVLNDLQRRIDLANASGAQLFLSLHLDANFDPSAGGTSTYYDSAREFASDNERFALLVQQNLVAAFQAAGLNIPDRGVIDDGRLTGNSLGVLPAGYNHLALLGPAVAGQLRPTQMPGALSEALFLSNPVEASAATDPVVQNTIATAFADAVTHFFSPQS